MTNLPMHSHAETPVFFSLRGGKILVAFLLLLALGGVEKSQAVLWGNTYQLGNAGSAVVSTTNSQWVTFTATEDMTISGGSFNSNGGVSALLEVGIYGVDGGGTPTGAALGSNTVTAAGAGTHSLTLPDIALTAGTVYAVQVSTATVGGSFAWRRNDPPTGGIQPFGDSDPNFLRGANASAPIAGMNVFYLQTDIGRAVGQPYRSSVVQNVAVTTTTLAQKFKFDLAGAGGGNLVDAIRLRLSIGATAPSELVTVKLINDAGTVLSTSTRDLSGAAEGADEFTFDLTSPIALTDTDDYFVGLYSNGSAGNSVNWFAWATADDSTEISASFQGSDAFVVSFGSQSDYTGATTDVGFRDFAFALDLIPEPSSLLLLLGGGALLALRRPRLRA